MKRQKREVAENRINERRSLTDVYGRRMLLQPRRLANSSCQRNKKMRQEEEVRLKSERDLFPVKRV